LLSSQVCGADKFGNIFVLRLPSSVSDDVDNPTGSRILWDSGKLGGAANKLDLMAQVVMVMSVMKRDKESETQWWCVLPC
jgi:splicing factor 3B subunit 3